MMTHEQFEHRYKFLRLPYEMVLNNVLSLNTRFNKAELFAHNDVPKMAKIVSVHQDYQSRSFDFLLEHDSFPIVPVGALPGYFSGELQLKSVKILPQ